MPTRVSVKTAASSPHSETSPAVMAAIEADEVSVLTQLEDVVAKGRRQAVRHRELLSDVDGPGQMWVVAFLVSPIRAA